MSEKQINFLIFLGCQGGIYYSESRKQWETSIKGFKVVAKTLENLCWKCFKQSCDLSTIKV